MKPKITDYLKETYSPQYEETLLEEYNNKFKVNYKGDVTKISSLCYSCFILITETDLS